MVRRAKQAVPAVDEDGEAKFLAAYDATQFERPSVAVDVVVMAAEAGELRALVHQRREHPHRGRYALPGGFVRMDESLDHAARRVLEEKVGLRSVFLEQLYTFGAPKRDPRTRIISVAYFALVDAARFPSPSDDGPVSARLVVPFEGETGGPVELMGASGVELPTAFDHALVLGTAVKRLRGKLDYSPVGFQLLPEQFTLRALQEVHETIRGESLNKDSFRRRMLASGLLEATGERESDVAYRPAELYRFTRRSAL
jgi:8-oxo-dGTP diphosphatase